MFEADVKAKPFDWVDSAGKELHVLCNCSLEAGTRDLLANRDTILACEDIVKNVKHNSKEDEDKEIILRVLQLLGRLARVPAGLLKVAKSKDILLKILLYYTLEDMPEYSKNSLIIFHTCCSMPGFADILLEEHKFTAKSFDGYIKVSKSRFH